MVVIWNVSIRKAIGVVLPKPPTCGTYATSIGFGVCRETSDPKIVKIMCIGRLRDVESIACIPRQVEVFTLSTRAWKSLSGNLPRKSIFFSECSVAKDGTLYWVASDGNTVNERHNLIVSFDLTSEEFREVSLPDSLAYRSSLSMSKLRDSLVVIDYSVEANIWMMEDESFTKLFTVDLNTPNALKVIGFSKSGEAIVIVSKDNHFGHG
ncbi:F-box protein At1g47810-like [Bidens hawaiensis]|uniref:F-box protein At1g47810-like n=1 Tax=Bidens hawaiensis TaxID=980011 RepID=UPI004049F02D